MQTCKTLFYVKPDKIFHLLNKQSRLFHGNHIFETAKSKVIISLLETKQIMFRFHREILYSLTSIKEKRFILPTRVLLPMVELCSQLLE